MMEPDSPTDRGNAKNEYLRRLARQRQMELMEATAYGTGPFMELDLGNNPNAETMGLMGEAPSSGGASTGSLRSRNNAAAAAGVTTNRMGGDMGGAGGGRTSITFSPGSSGAGKKTVNPSLFSTRGSAGVTPEDTFSINLMDHDTGVYKEDSPRGSNFLANFRAGMGSFFANRYAQEEQQRRQQQEQERFNLHETIPSEPDYLGQSYYATAGIKQPPLRPPARVSPVGACCRNMRDAVWNNPRRRNLLCLTLVGIIIVIITVLILRSDNPATEYYYHHVTEKQLREANDLRFNGIMDQIVQHSVTHTSAFLDIYSAEYHALRWIAYSDPAQLDPQDPMLLERYVLAVLFYSSYVAFVPMFGNQKPIRLGDKQWEGVPNPGWIRKDFWMTERGICEWYGITCEPNSNGEQSYNGNAPIVAVNLTKNHIVGSIPPELKALEHLRSIDLSNNRMSGTFPWQVGKMFHIRELYLQNNRFNGSLPEQIGFMEGLEHWSMSTNLLTGSIPTEINRLYNLETLALDHNQLTGTIPSLKDVKKLFELHLNHNHLIGKFPFVLCLLQDLYEVQLNDNELSGTMPPELGSVRHLRKLALENNKLVGKIPESMFMRMNHLTELTLQNNLLTGSLPSEMGSEEILKIVRLNNNKLSGRIPNTWDRMSSLEILYLQENALTGPLPTWFGTMVSLKELALNNNKLSGMIPTQIGLAVNLKSLYVENNQMQGRVPTQMGQLENLQTVRMHNNQIKGFIPDDVCDLTSFKLKYLSADCKPLSGKIMKCDCCNKCY